MDVSYGKPEEDLQTHYIESVKEGVDKVYEFSRIPLKLCSNRTKHYPDIGITTRTYDKRDFVWLFNPHRKNGLTPKLQRAWESPYKVMKKINDLGFWVQLHTQYKPKMIHVEYRRNMEKVHFGGFPPPLLTLQEDGLQQAPMRLRSMMTTMRIVRDVLLSTVDHLEP